MVHLDMSRFSMKNDLFSLFTTQKYCMALENKYFIFTFTVLLLLSLYKICKHQNFSSFPTNFILKNKTSLGISCGKTKVIL